MPTRVGWVEILIIAVVLIVLFGGKKIPELFKGLGEGVREFKKSAKDDSEKEKE